MCESVDYTLTPESKKYTHFSFFHQNWPKSDKKMSKMTKNAKNVIFVIFDIFGLADVRSLVYTLTSVS